MSDAANPTTIGSLIDQLYATRSLRLEVEKTVKDYKTQEAALRIQIIRTLAILALTVVRALQRLLPLSKTLCHELMTGTRCTSILRLTRPLKLCSGEFLPQLSVTAGTRVRIFPALKKLKQLICH